MQKTPDCFIGYDFSDLTHACTFVAIDAGQKVLALGQGELQDGLAFAAGKSSALAAINGPAHPRRDMMRRPEVRSQYKPVLPEKRWLDLRQADYDLILLGVPVVRTPLSARGAPASIRRSFQFASGLEQLGYMSYPGDDAPRVWMETHADACYKSWTGVLAFPAGSLEGRLQRQLVLSDQGIALPDAMEFFEEITRYKLLHGNLPLKRIYSGAELNAFIAAKVAWLAAFHPNQLRWLGHVDEGRLAIPDWEKMVS